MLILQMWGRVSVMGVLLLLLNCLIVYAVYPNPEQVKISLTKNATELMVSWVTVGANVDPKPCVQYGPTALSLTVNAVPDARNFTGGNWSGVAYRALLSGLQPAVSYQYRVGSCFQSVFSAPFQFLLPAPTAPQVWVAYSADIGVGPAATSLRDALLQERSRAQLDAVLFGGDITYSNNASVTSSDMTSDQTRSDLWSNMFQPLVATVPLMTGAGAHEQRDHTFAAYDMRFGLDMPSDTQQRWFSYDMKNVHFIHLSAWDNTAVGGPQNVWLQADLAAAQAAKSAGTTDWIVVLIHLPLWSTNAASPSNTTLQTNLESLFKGVVDLVLSGDAHCYERTRPLFNGNAQTGPRDVYSPSAPFNDYIYSPSVPVYVTAGVGGIQPLDLTFLTPLPFWSRAQDASFNGYVLIEFTGGLNPTLFLRALSSSGSLRDTFTIIQNSTTTLSATTSQSTFATSSTSASSDAASTFATSSSFSASSTTASDRASTLAAATTSATSTQDLLTSAVTSALSIGDATSLTTIASSNAATSSATSTSASSTFLAASSSFATATASTTQMSTSSLSAATSASSSTTSASSSASPSPSGSNPTPQKKKSTTRSLIIILIAIFFALFLCVGIVLLVFCCIRKSSGEADKNGPTEEEMYLPDEVLAQRYPQMGKKTKKTTFDVPRRDWKIGKFDLYTPHQHPVGLRDLSLH